VELVVAALDNEISHDLSRGFGGIVVEMEFLIADLGGLDIGELAPGIHVGLHWCFPVINIIRTIIIIIEEDDKAYNKN